MSEGKDPGDIELRRVLEHNAELLAEVKKWKEKARELEASVAPLQQFKTEAEKQLKTLGEEKEALTKQVETQAKELHTYKLDNKALASFSAAGVQRPAQLLKLVGDQLQLNDKGEIVTADGKPLDAYITTLKAEGSDYEHFFAGTGARGSGAPPGGAKPPSGAGGGVVNPWDPKTRNLTRQMQLAQENPELAKTMAAQFGVTLDF